MFTTFSSLDVAVVTILFLLLLIFSILVAISEKAEGPYVKSEYNPISNSGHETLLWQYKDGMAALLSTDGVEKNTVQYAEDGINFEIMAVLKNAPEAAGPFRGGDKNENLNGLDWGLCHYIHKGRDYIGRFQKDTRLKEYFLKRHTYE